MAQGSARAPDLGTACVACCRNGCTLQPHGAGIYRSNRSFRVLGHRQRLLAISRRTGSEALDVGSVFQGRSRRSSSFASIYPQPHDIRMDIIVAATSVDYRSLPDKAGRGQR